ncbi:hypothetical protein GE09DRAFT_304573 [Coniochaeta sp. 2T2.1]|nr:hypothetical protein GE09DRAFT_304573 [Coniochaeta sp. 2T2.1]
MQFSTLALAALVSLATAQTNNGMTVHVVTVGANGTLTFVPDNLKPAVGDMVQFQFLAGNHTVTQSTFDNPCQPIGMHSNVTGFHSGFQDAKAAMAKGVVDTYSIMINDTKPIWVYCATGKHCVNGMAMVINENSSSNKTLSAYKSLAAGASTVVPGTNTTGGGTSGTTPSGSATSPAVTTDGAMGLAAPSVVGLLAVVAAVFML